MEAAGIPYRDGAGLVADFHSWRPTLISNLARGGAHPNRGDFPRPRKARVE